MVENATSSVVRSACKGSSVEFYSRDHWQERSRFHTQAG